MGRASRRKFERRTGPKSAEAPIPQELLDAIMAEGTFNIAYPSGKTFALTGSFCILPYMEIPGEPNRSTPAVLERSGRLAILDTRGTVTDSSNGHVLYTPEMGELNASMAERIADLLCRPVHLDLSNDEDRKIATDTGVYTGSVEGECKECGCAVWIGPRQQQAIEVCAGHTVTCFRCVKNIALPADAVLTQLGNSEFAHLL